MKLCVMMIKKLDKKNFDISDDLLNIAC